MVTDELTEAVYQRLLHNIASKGWQTNREAYIPQRRYIPSQGSSMRESGDPELIFFNMEGGPFISASDALKECFSGLVRGEETVLHGCSSTISLHIEWPGYRSWTDQIRTLDWPEPPNKITRCKLATEAAKRLEKFLQRSKSMPVDPDAMQWRAGVQGGIQLQNIVVVAFERVALGSWEPHLMYRQSPSLA
ncbi:hypothetical protein BDM02DRAFT_3111456 [Thelephora ganbajun]|uniref:Uncharacterized protein n=1 Tax=Thelephora ganbajun TaxID=370292 RepID=A0ACB6ZMJ0_THEGA|nr:hypothetical protein BDM02DRAFT_3111456 [Thelephora ganbajun]